jgi:hypothetical protein
MTSSTINHHVNATSSVNDASNDYQLYTEHSVLGAALNRLMSPHSQDTIGHSYDDTRLTNNDGVSFVSAPKNVKFLIPLGRSGITSNESTFGLVESTTRTITHVKDIFPMNFPTEHQTVTNNTGDMIDTFLSSNSDEKVDVFNAGRRQDRHDIMKSDSEEIPLLSNDNSHQK